MSPVHLASAVCLASQAPSDPHSVDELRAEVANLRQALASRPTIDMAKGIIMARTGCGPEHAFELLVAQSQAENLKLRDVAAELVALVGRPQVTNGPVTPPRAVRPAPARPQVNNGPVTPPRALRPAPARPQVTNGA